MITLAQAEQFANEANINGVAAFLNQPESKEFDQVTINLLKENLMAAYIAETNGNMDEYIFSNIKRIANL